MVFIGSLAGSATASIDNFTTTGLVSTPVLQIGPTTTANEQFNRFYYGRQGSITGVTDTGGTFSTVTVPGMASTDFVFVTAQYTGSASPLPSIYAKVYDKSAGSFRLNLRLDDETPGTVTCSVYWVVMN
jgi:hypothetical protein